MNQNLLFRPDYNQDRWYRHAFFMVLSFVIFLSGLSAQCPPGNVVLNNQAQVNAFLVNYPNCTQINGNLSIVSVPNNSITDLSPLANITTITGSLNVTNHLALQNLSGLSGLTTIGVNFYIDSNPGLPTIGGLNNLQTIGGFLYFLANPSLQSINGFNSLQSIGTGFWINNNDALTQMQGFNSLSSISGSIVIVDNTNLESIVELSNVTSNQGFIHIETNPSLTSVYGIHNLNPAGITFLYLLHNAQLSICGVQSVCDYLNTGTTNYWIQTNLPGCQSKADVLANCVYQPVLGCTDVVAHNYDPNAEYDDGSCETCTDEIQNGDETGVDCGGSLCNACPEIYGCTNPTAHNYDPDANVDDGSCQTCDDGIMNGDETDVDCGGSLCVPCVYGCTDPNAHNYNPEANISFGTCMTCNDGITNGDETSVDCGGSICPADCPDPPYVPCADVILYVDPDAPDHEGSVDERDIYLMEALFFLEGVTSDAPYFFSNVKRKSDYIKHDWTTDGACIDGIPDGDKEDVDKGKEYLNCIPLVRGDINGGERLYKLNVWDFYGSIECTGSYWVDTITYANYAVPEIQIATEESQDQPSPAAIINRESANQLSKAHAIPNPGQDDIHITWHTPTHESVRLIITDMSGRVLSDLALTSFEGTNKLQLDMSRFNPGLYIFTLQKQNALESFKWIKAE